MKYDEANIAYNGQINMIQNIFVKFNIEVSLLEN